MQKHQQWWPSWISDQHKNINLVGHQTINHFLFFKCHGIVVSEMKKLTGNSHEQVSTKKDYWCVQCVCACHIHHWLAACCEKGSCVRKPSSPIIVSHTVRPMWPIYGNLFEVVYGNWMIRGSRQNHKVSEKTRPLDARHAWPTGVWTCTGVCKPSSQLWVKYLHCFVDGEGNSIIKPPLPCGIPIYGKGFGRKPRG